MTFTTEVYIHPDDQQQIYIQIGFEFETKEVFCQFVESIKLVQINQLLRFSNLYGVSSLPLCDDLKTHSLVILRCSAVG